MKSMSVWEIRAELSRVLEMVRGGERIGVGYGSGQEPVAMIVPYESARPSRRDVGFLDGKVTIEFTDDYEMTEDELIGAETEEGR